MYDVINLTSCFPPFMASILFLLFLEIFIYFLLFYFYYRSYWFLVLSVLWEVSWANDWSFSELCFIVIQYAYIYLLHIVSAINEKVFSDTAWWYAFYCKLTSIFSFSSSSYFSSSSSFLFSSLLMYTYTFLFVNIIKIHCYQSSLYSREPESHLFSQVC